MHDRFRRFVLVKEHPALEVFDAPGFDGGADELVLALEAFGEDERVEARVDEVLIRRTLARQNRSAHVDERQDQRRVESFVFRLDVVHDAVKLYIRVEASDHSDFRKARGRGGGGKTLLKSCQRGRRFKQ